MASTGQDRGRADGAPWPLFRGFAGFSPSWIGADLIAGVTLAAIAVPEQMATARLAGAPAQVGFFAFIAGSLAYAVFGGGRRLSAGADSTITPIFAGALAAIATTGAPHPAALAAALALIVGAVVLGAGLLRLGWIGNLLSIPVTNGFLAGIAIHIIVSQAPAALGVPAARGSLPAQILSLAGAAHAAQPAPIAIALAVIVVIVICHRLSARLPGPLIGLAGATAAALALNLPAKGLAVLGPVVGGLPRLAPPALDLANVPALTPLALLVALVVMGQTAATVRAFPDGAGAPDVDRDFIGVGAGNLLSGLFGAFPVNASPPRTAVVAESGGRSPLAGLAAAAILAAVLAFATGWLRAAPLAALSGVLLFVAGRLVRVADIAAIARASPVEGALVLATAAAIVVLPIAGGVAAGVAFSLLHGVWSNARVRVTRLRRIPNSTIWWPPVPSRPMSGQTEPGVAVLGYAAPLTFLNAESFAREMLAEASAGDGETRLVVLEAAGLVEIDYTGAQALRRVVLACRAAGRTFAVARLESVAAQEAFIRLGLQALIGEDHMFESVAEAVAALAPGQDGGLRPHSTSRIGSPES
jgi:sulfate permease, SulP family